jgi:hypothetical protein
MQKRVELMTRALVAAISQCNEQRLSRHPKENDIVVFDLSDKYKRKVTFYVREIGQDEGKSREPASDGYANLRRTGGFWTAVDNKRLFVPLDRRFRNLLIIC